MAQRKEDFSVGEWYHCFARGVEKRRVFQTRTDYERYVQLLYLCNSSKTIHRSNLSLASAEIFSVPREETLAGIGAYCLMPNHVHLLLREKQEGGISRFMQKLGTAYTMYFNIRNERGGGLFTKPFRSKHVSDDAYLQQVVRYIHFNPAELLEPDWKSGNVREMKKLEQFLLNYPYSSLPDHTHTARAQTTLIDKEIFEITSPAPFRKILYEARAYYEETAKNFS